MQDFFKRFREFSPLVQALLLTIVLVVLALLIVLVIIYPLAAPPIVVLLWRFLSWTGNQPRPRRRKKPKSHQ